MDDYLQEVEREILEVIERHLIDGSMKAERAKEIARYVLDALHPPLTLEEIRIKVHQIDDHFPELIPVVLMVENTHQDRLKETVMNRVRELIKTNKLDEAHSLLKEANKEGLPQKL